MGIDEKLMHETCCKITDEYVRRANCLGYNYFQVNYSKTAFEKGENVVYILAEFYKPLLENRTDRAKLRKLIPRIYESGDMSVKIVLEYVNLPSKVKKQLRDMQNSRNEREL